MPVPGRFGAVICAMVTPFDDDGRLDIAGAVKLARWLVDNGNDGLVLAGTTGEAPALSDQEKHDLWKAVREAVGVPVIANTGTASTAHSVELTKMAADVGADAALVVTPYYNRPSQAGIEAHFRAIARSDQVARYRVRHTQADRARVAGVHSREACGRRGDRRSQGCGWFDRRHCGLDRTITAQLRGL